MTATSRRSPAALAQSHATHYNRGETVCPHVTLWPMEEINRELMATLCTDVLRPAVAEQIVAAARAQFDASLRPDAHATARTALATVERELARLTEAIASGSAPIPALMERVRSAEARRQQLVAGVHASQVTVQPKWADIERRIRRNLNAWRARFSGGIAEARSGLRELLTSPILFTPCVVRGHHAHRFSGRLGLQRVFGGTALVTGMASPAGFGRLWMGDVHRRIFLAA